MAVTINVSSDGNSITVVTDIYPIGKILAFNTLNYNFVGNQIQLSSTNPSFTPPGLLNLSDINGGAYTTAAAFVTFFKSFFRKAGGTPAFSSITGAPTDNPALASALATKQDAALSVNSKVILFGDSEVAQASGTSGNQTAYQNYCFVPWAFILSKSVLYMPQNGNQGLSGDTTTNMVTRLGAALDIKPQIVILEAGTNELQSLTAQQIINNLTIIRDAFVANGATVLFLTIFPRYGTAALTGPQEVIRQTINTFIKSVTTPNIIPIDCEATLSSSASFRSDGLHLNSTGAYALGAVVAPYIVAITKQIRPTDMLTPDNSFNANLFLTGTAGSKAGGATGTVASSYTLDAQSVTGLTAAGSIVAVNNQNTQQITLGGSYTATSKMVQFYIVRTTNLPSIGDLMEGFLDYKIITNDPNVLGIQMNLQIFNSSFSAINWQQSMSAIDQLSNQQSTGVVYTSRTPAGTNNGIPFQVNLTVGIILKDQASTTPINFVIQIIKMGARRVVDNTVPTPAFSANNTQAASMASVKNLNLLKTIFTPTTGGSVTLVNHYYNIINPAGTLAALTHVMPTGPLDGDVVKAKYTQAITAITWPSAVKGAPTSVTAGSEVELCYDLASLSWY